eukprot:scaffold871_cov130-Cylindrotheca_fusiformis.AAC.4
MSILLQRQVTTQVVSPTEEKKCWEEPQRLLEKSRRNIVAWKNCSVIGVKKEVRVAVGTSFCYCLGFWPMQSKTQRQESRIGGLLFFKSGRIGSHLELQMQE